MSTLQVKNSSTGTMGTIAAKRSRFEKSETSYGKIPAAAYAAGDTLSFDHIPMKELIHARFVALADNNSNTPAVLELFTGDSLASALPFDIINDGDSADISYFVTYIRGTGKVKDSTTTAGEGKLIKITVASSSN